MTVRAFIAVLPVIFPTVGSRPFRILAIAPSGSSRFDDPAAATGSRTVVRPISRY
jgi:hypothetical protein